MAEKSTGESHQQVGQFERTSGHFINLIMGALLLWVGQSTFEHSGRLASIHERVVELGSDQDDLTSQLFTRTESRWTRQHAMDAHKTINERIEHIRSDLTNLTREQAAHEAKLGSQKEQFTYFREHLRYDENCEQIAGIKERLNGLASHIATIHGGLDGRHQVGRVEAADTRPALDP